MTEKLDTVATRRAILAFIASHAMFYGAAMTPFWVAAYAPSHLTLAVVVSVLVGGGGLWWMRADARASRARVADNGSRAESSTRSDPRNS
jgi:hypothetical protein